MLTVVHDYTRKVAVGVPQLLRSLQKLAAADVILPHHHKHCIYLRAKDRGVDEGPNGRRVEDNVVIGIVHEIK